MADSSRHAVIHDDANGLDDPHLGQRIQHYRERRGMSKSTLAAATGLSRTYLTQVEAGTANPSVLTLRRVARALSVPVLYLFVNDNVHGSIRRRSERVVMRQAGSQTERELLSPDIAHRSTLALVRYDPEMAEPEGESVHDDEECFLVLRGSIQVRIGTQQVQLDIGDCMHVDARTPHAVWNPGVEMAEILISLTPSPI